MIIAPEVEEVEALAAHRGLKMGRVLAHAGVATSTYWRWRNAGLEPKTGTIRKLKAAIVELADAA